MSTPYYRSDYDQANRPTDFHRSSSLGPYRDHEQEPLSLASAFDNLDLNGATDTRFPPSPTRSRSVHESPSRHVHTVSEPEDSGGQHIGGPWESIDSQQRLQDFSYPSNQPNRHTISPAMPRDVGLYRHRPHTSAMPSTFGLPSPSYDRYGGFGGDYHPSDHQYQRMPRTYWPGSAGSRPHPHSFSREYHFYRSRDPYVDMRIRQTGYTADPFDRDRGARGPAVLCNCRTCVAHRYPTASHSMRDWSSFPPADEFGAREGPVYEREQPVYPIARSSYSPRMPHFSSARDDDVDDWPGVGYPGEDYRSDSPDYVHNSGSFGDRNGYRSGERRYGGSSSPRLDRYPAGFGGYGYSSGYRDDDYDSDDSRNGVASEHEYSDGASYTGYRHYDNYSDGEYSSETRR